MDALQAAQRIYESTFANLADKVLEVNVEQALQIATFCASLAQAEQLKRIADALHGTYPQSETESSMGNILKDIALDVAGIAMKPTR